VERLVPAALCDDGVGEGMIISAVGAG
jgi:hypothetical protein